MRKSRFLHREIKDTGFSDKVSNQGWRLLNKDGTYNVKKEGLTFRERFHLFHWLITMTWGRFLLIMLTCYAGVNLIFAMLYYLVGVEGLSGDAAFTTGEKLLKAFYFSSQTLTTVGYGAIAPINTVCNSLAAFESFSGLMGFAMATGLLYGRFSKPKAKILFSNNALISPYQGDKIALMMRMANVKNTQMINVAARIIFSRIENIDGTEIRKFYPLKLEIEKINMLVSTWTIVHPIDAESPLYHATEKEIHDSRAEIMLQLNGYDETYSQEVHMRTSYLFDEIIFGAKFERMLANNSEGNTLVHFDKLNSWEKTPLPEVVELP
jgi:inward rectifier potassium channel